VNAEAKTALREEAERQLAHLHAQLETERDPIEREAFERLTDAWEALLRLADTREQPTEPTLKVEEGEQAEHGASCESCGYWFWKNACCRN
jgi:hypothetical protein